MIPIPTTSERRAYLETLRRHERDVESLAPVTECLWRDGQCQTRAGLLLAVHDAADQPFTGRYQRALWSLAAHSCGPRPSVDLQEGAQVLGA
ncbi:MAG: hypothetical protein ABL993_02515 [Vicinamibacterales bacterium]